MEKDGNLHVLVSILIIQHSFNYCSTLPFSQYYGVNWEWWEIIADRLIFIVYPWVWWNLDFPFKNIPNSFQRHTDLNWQTGVEFYISWNKWGHCIQHFLDILMKHINKNYIPKSLHWVIFLCYTRTSRDLMEKLLIKLYYGNIINNDIITVTLMTIWRTSF